MHRLILISLIALLLLSGCEQGDSAAVQAVENFYQAMVDKNDEQLSTLVCGEWEERALLEYDSFGGVATELQDFSCQESGTEGEFTLVTCQGKIVASYGNEKMDFPLADRVHRVRNQGGDMLVCGY